MKSDETGSKTLRINCGTALLLKDREHLLDRYEKVNLNCGTLIVSSEINAKLAEKNASLNTGTVHIHDIKGEVVRLNSNTVIDGKTSYKDLFVLATEDLIISGKGAESFREAEGGIVTGVLYYPESTDMACLAKVQGDMRSYPDDAQVVLGNRTLEQALADAAPGKKHIWVSGELTALDEKTAARAREEHFTITSRSLLTYEGLNKAYGDLFISPQRSLVPDGYELTGSIKSAELVLHGPKLYVQGNLDFEEKDLGVLEEMESIIVKGRANLPSSCAKAFRKIGQADDYYVFEGRLHTVNGFEQFSHDQLRTMAERGDRLTITVNGCLLFADDVTADDMEAIAALSYNGMVLIPGVAKGALSAKIKGANGHMGDAETFQKLTGLSLEEMLNKQGGGPAEGINAGTYTLI
ncbi:hypothetical protein FACS1894163_00970 [Spirochaetia bacterium]|nr:hypothetical protein FACS1894163_00970 [Spirochaetia bacterium]